MVPEGGLSEVQHGIILIYLPNNDNPISLSIYDDKIYVLYYKNDPVEYSIYSKNISGDGDWIISTLSELISEATGISVYGGRIFISSRNNNEIFISNNLVI